jgi:hypothetical protein
MNTFYNFTTKTVVDPLANIKHFYINPYMPENHKLLRIEHKIRKNNVQDVVNTITDEGILVTLLPLELIVEGVCSIKWTEPDKFCIDNRIWCKIVGHNMDTVRIDTVRF